MTAAFALPFFLIVASDVHVQPPSSTSDESHLRFRSRGLLVNITTLIAGLLIPLFLIGVYNWARFGSFIETGFGKALLYTNVLYEARSFGLFSVKHIPKNLFMMLLQGPVPVGGEDTPILHFPYIKPSLWGMGLFFTTPALIYAFRAPFRERVVKACWAGVVSVALPLSAYYGIGYVQFGYRYALDFMPFLILLTAYGLRQPMTNRARSLVLASVLINMWGAVTLALQI
jgi:hypothetical protein